MKQLIKKYNHAWVLLYVLLYMPWFAYLERTITTKFTVIHTKLDDAIPFLEVFIIPYFLWFAFVFIAVAYFFFKDKNEFYQCTAFLFIGMTIALIIYSIWPNGHDLRPNLDALGRENLFTRILGWLYTTDTCTNVCPSIHAYNSIGVCIALLRSKHLKENRVVRIGSVVLTVLICMSTVFLKQHSIFDVVCACVLAVVMYLAVYVPDYSGLTARHREKADPDTSTIS